ncbi:preprotein translocase subunit SecD, partial [Microbacterium sp. SUBG005]
RSWGRTATTRRTRLDPSLPATPTASPTNASDPAYTPALQAEFLSYDCANPPSNPAQAPADQPMITCDVSGQAKYILGPVELDGNDISDATNGQEQNTGQWAVNLVFNDQGTQKFADVSQRLYGAQAPFNQFAFVLDGSVLSAPSMNGIIVDGRASRAASPR